MSKLSYHFSWEKAHTQIVNICFSVKSNTEDVLMLQLPVWRPGRYELGNFAKNIISMRAETPDGKMLHLEKTGGHTWRIDTPDTPEIKIMYSYYAGVLNAGSTWLHTDQLYVNPVNCCVYLPHRIDEECSLYLDVPQDYLVAIDRIESNTRTYTFDNFDRLADTPFIASPTLQHSRFEVEGHEFNLWFQGLKEVRTEKLHSDFEKFCKEQLRTMGALPGRAYHFLFQISAEKAYHGVEHLYSTVIALGPEKELFDRSLYGELLGVSSHELFHAWNVKWIRPQSMLPYDFTRENYSRLGWVYEGVTTWYGDLFLYRSGVFDFNQFKATVDEKLKKHFANYGRFNMSVGASSFDTWLDGYISGAPHRKTNIYTEGSLLTFMLDSRIRAHSNDLKSFDDVMRMLLEDAKKGIGYTFERLVEILDEICPLEHAKFLQRFAEGTDDFEPELREAFRRIGLDIGVSLDLKPIEHAAGMKLNYASGNVEVLLVAPGSPAEKAGISGGDVLIALNGTRWDLAVEPVLLPDTLVKITAFRAGKLIEFDVLFDKDKYFASRTLCIMKETEHPQRSAFRSWSSREFPEQTAKINEP